MNIDEYDIKIIEELSKLKPNKGEITTYRLTNKIFPEVKDSHKLKAKDRFITYRLRKLCGYGLVEITSMENTTYYYLLLNNISIQDVSIKGKKHRMCFVHLNDKWWAHSI